MANLKELRNKIGVVQSTRKVTAAMKLVAGVKLKKAEQKASASREYASELEGILARIRTEYIDINCELFSGREEIHTEMLVVFASDKGLCGNFNYLINREVLDIIAAIHSKNRKVHIICIGAKVFDILKYRIRDDESIEFMSDFYKNEKLFENSNKLAEKIIADFNSKNVDAVSIVYTRCYSAIRRQVEIKRIVPLTCEPNPDKTDTIFEPDVESVLGMVAPYNVAIQLYQT
ncbi:MAG: F0F1 ATP synthase subunit gamma, partial [Holosporaceae bacterium]|nr:F0F1 ATP synthase subunit gamma [Holosporaceae bacterium]